MIPIALAHSLYAFLTFCGVGECIIGTWLCSVSLTEQVFDISLDGFVSDFYPILNLSSACACKKEQFIIETDTIVLSHFSDEQKGMLGPAFLRS